VQNQQQVPDLAVRLLIRLTCVRVSLSVVMLVKWANGNCILQLQL
jgi:hypothetical protein